MLNAIGIDVDDTFAQFIRSALDNGLPIRVLNLRAAVEGEWRIDISEQGLCRFVINEEVLEFRRSDSFFCRMIDLSSEQPSHMMAARWRFLLNGLRAWLEGATGIVVNRPLGGLHNGSKPLHEAILRSLGFLVPESITGCDTIALKEFVSAGHSVSKTICGIRADTATVTEEDLGVFQPAMGPVHFQRFVEGADARIHVVGNRLVAQRVNVKDVDYRRAGSFDDLEIFNPPPSLKESLIKANKELGLEFAGWDFKIDRDGLFWCLEANPMPGYGPYDLRCNGAISDALLEHLEGGRASRP